MYFYLRFPIQSTSKYLTFSFPSIFFDSASIQLAILWGKTSLKSTCILWVSAVEENLFLTEGSNYNMLSLTASYSYTCLSNAQHQLWKGSLIIPRTRSFLWGRGTLLRDEGPSLKLPSQQLLLGVRSLHQRLYHFGVGSCYELMHYWPTCFYQSCGDRNSQDWSTSIRGENVNNI